MRPQRNSQQNKRKNTIKYGQIFAIHFFEFYFGPWCLTIRRKQHSNTMTRVALNQIVLCWKFQDIENQIFLVHSWQQLFWFVFYFSVFITFSPNHSVSSDACSLVRSFAQYAFHDYNWKLYNFICCFFCASHFFCIILFLPRNTHRLLGKM